jgi:TolB-like protein/class 3 adenylate cyclase
MSETRKLAAILVSDVVGYSRLACADEDRILARLRALRSDLIDPIISVHHGRIVKRTGDGSLLEFRSVVDAVRCAIEVLNGMLERNAGLPPEKRIEFRIGVHLGDVVEESDGDLMGDGVNVAARLEGIAQPGSICLSEDAYRQVSGRLDMAVADLGPTHLKNIERPIRVYSLHVGQPAQAKPAIAPRPRGIVPAPKLRLRLAPLAIGIAALALLGAGAWQFLASGRAVALSAPAVAVLPFDNLGGDGQAARLADGMTEDVITDLARYKDLLVIGRNSTMAYKGKPVDIRKIASDLNVRFVLAGSIQHQADQLRVTAELTDATSGAQVWSERWDRPAQDLFAVQAEVADKVADAIGDNGGSNIGPIRASLLAEAKKRRPASLSAYDLWLLAHEQRYLITKEGNAKGFEYINKAIELDPNFAAAYALRGWLQFQHMWLFGFDSVDWATQQKELEKDMRRALALDPSNASAHAGLIQYLADQAQWTEASAEIDRALQDHPRDVAVLWEVASQLAPLGRPEESVAVADLALRLDPQMPRGRLIALVGPYFYDRKFERAIEVADQIPEEVRMKFDRFWRAASYALLGRDGEAQRAKDDLVAKNGEQVMELWRNEGQVFARSNEQDLLREGFRKLGFRVCATEAELKKIANPKRLPECVKS